MPSARSSLTTNQIKQRGSRASRGPWTIYTAPSAGAIGRLITALGRTAGGAVTRSRVRRIARDVFGETEPGFDMLLLARGNLEREPRRNIRTALRGLMARGVDGMTRRRFPQEAVGG